VTDIPDFPRRQLDTDSNQVHCLPFTRGYCATVFPPRVRRIGERCTAIPYDRAAILERYRRFMKPQALAVESIQPCFPSSDVARYDSDRALLSWSLSIVANPRYLDTTTSDDPVGAATTHQRPPHRSLLAVMLVVTLDRQSVTISSMWLAGTFRRKATTLRSST
jgi:hypothetical protein